MTDLQFRVDCWPPSHSKHSAGLFRPFRLHRFCHSDTSYSIVCSRPFGEITRRRPQWGQLVETAQGMMTVVGVERSFRFRGLGLAAKYLVSSRTVQSTH